ncbi:MAG: hypothetical protein KKB20_15475 [Proteobacteria bacterium]|nr:hypothetical protein [Pseudomonadota bacterium]
MSEAKLVLLDARLDRQKIVDIIGREGLVRWAALIQDYGRIIEIEEALPPTIQRMETGPAMRRAVQALRTPYYRLTADLGRKHQSLAWWSNSISERNNMNSRLFLNCCYVDAARRLIERDGDLCLVCDDPTVLKIVAGCFASSRRIVVETSGRLNGRALNGYLHSFLYVLGTCVQGLWRWFQAKASLYWHDRAQKERPRGPADLDCLVHTWADEKSFGANDRFNDRYFTTLPDWLRQRGYKTASLVTVYAIERSFWRALEFFRKDPAAYILPEDYCTWYDYLFPVRLYLRRLRFGFKGLVLNGVDMSALFTMEKQRDAGSFVLLYYPLMKRLADKGVRPSVILEAFENMLSDKMVALGVKKYLPGTRLFGFFHLAVTQNILCNFIGPGEAEFAPLPDRIICNGPVFRDRLAEAGYPEDKLSVGVALRYQYLWKQKAPDESEALGFQPPAGPMRILVPLPLVEDGALELIGKTMAAAGNDYHIYLKPHPMGLGLLDRLPDGIRSRVQALTGSMDEALARTDVVVTAATSAALDAVLSGKPLVRLGREAEIDLDPLEGLESLDRVYYSPKEIKAVLADYQTRIRNGSPLIGYDPRTLLPGLFAPPSDEGLSAFIPSDLRKTRGPSVQ